MTPLKGLTFVYNEIFLNRKNDPEVWYEFIDWSDNPYLDDEEEEDADATDENDPFGAAPSTGFSGVPAIGISTARSDQSRSVAFSISPRESITSLSF